MLKDHTLNKREALDELIKCVQEIGALRLRHAQELEALELKQENLSKIVLGETMVPAALRAEHRLNRVTSKAPTGNTQQTVLKVLHENGGWMSCGDISKATGIAVSTISVCLRKGMPSGFVNIDRKETKHFLYSAAVRGEPRMLNHE